jgi:hypothetical protein
MLSVKGVDFPDVDIVVNIGLPPTICDAVQRAGRVVRRDGKTGLFVIFYESWVKTIGLSGYKNEYVPDPDRPRAVLTAHSSRQDRASFSTVSIIQNDRCIRESFGSYLGDLTEDGECLYFYLHYQVIYIFTLFSLALKFTTRFCCDRHENGFDLADFLPGSIYTQEAFDMEHTQPKPTAKRNKYRPVKDREEVTLQLRFWRRKEHTQHPLKAVFPEWRILTDKDIDAITLLKPSNMTSVDDLIQCLPHHPTNEWVATWGHKLFNFMSDLNDTLTPPPVTGKRKSESTLPSTSPPKKPRIPSSISTSPSRIPLSAVDSIHSPPSLLSKPRPKPRPNFRIKDKENR